MIPRIRQLLDATPFVPFVIRTGDGREYSVPTADHAAVNPQRSRVLVFGDDESETRLSALHIAAVVEQVSTGTN